MLDYRERPTISFDVFNDDGYWITYSDLLTADPGCTFYLLTCVGGFPIGPMLLCYLTLHTSETDNVNIVDQSIETHTL